jgi:CPA2 family monovalent cation:H+ antiporter-2
MAEQFLAQILILLAGSLLVQSVMRRFRLPPILGYLVVGMLLGPYALGLVTNDATIRTLAEVGVVFLVFTLGLEFSLARMVAMKSEVLGIGGLQVLLCATVFGGMAFAAGVPAGVAIVIGGALAMSSTAIVLRQLGDQLELTRVHARLAVGILLFQDLAFAPFLALATALTGSGEVPGPLWLLGMVGRAILALLVVLVLGRWLLRPLFREITHHRSTETFTLMVLLVALGGAWATHALGLSTALGGFLAGMLLAETEFKHQTEAVIKPFENILVGVFFVLVGMLLDLRLLLAQLPLVLLLLVLLVMTKTLIVTLIVRQFVPNSRKALRTAVTVSMGGEFGFALLTLLLQGQAADPRIVQALLTAVALSMLLGPLLVRYNGRIADRLLRREDSGPSDVALETVATKGIASRAHVIVCGFGRVGQNVARVLVVISFDDPETALRIVRAVRSLREDVPTLVRTEDDSRLEALQRAGATEVVPDTFETSLSLVSHVLLLLNVPSVEVQQTTDHIRHDRYALLRSVFVRRDDEHAQREQLHSVVLPPRASGVGRSLQELGFESGPVAVSAIRRGGVTHRDPPPATRLREGDVVVLRGHPELLEHAESRLLMG